MDAPNIRLLGSIELAVPGRRPAAFATRKSRLLFAFLVLARGRVLARDTVAAQFWPQLAEAQGRKALNTDLWRVREAFAHVALDAEDYLYSGADGIGFRDDSPHWLDIAQVEAAATQAAVRSPEAADDALLAALEQAAALYRGDLLHDVFEDWCLVQREAFRAAQLRMLDFAMRAHMARRQWRNALLWGERLLAVDALQEHVHRAMMHCHCSLGNRPAAIQQYQSCAQLLSRELGVSPMEETRRAYQAILSRTPRVPLDPPPGAEAQRVPAAHGDASILRAVGLAIASIETARACLLDASAKLASDRPAEPGPGAAG